MKHVFSDVRPFTRDPLSFLRAKSESSSERLVPLALGFNRVFLVNDAELLTPILKAPEELSDKGGLVRKLEPVARCSSLTLSGEAHELRRAPLYEALARATVEGLVPELLGEIRRAAFQLMRQSSFDAHVFGAGLALKLINTVLFGHRALSEADEQALVEAIRLVEDDLSKEMFRVVPAMPWTKHKYRRNCLIAKDIMGIIFNNAGAMASESSMFGLLKRIGFSNQEIIDEIITILPDLRRTMGSAIGFNLYYLATNNCIRTEITQEADACLSYDGDIAKYKLKTTHISASLGMEVLRLFPSSWWFAREVKMAHDIDGYSLKPRDSLLISPWIFHRSARYWKDPDLLDLSRDYGSKAYIPFGAGPRACVAMGLATLQLQLITLDLAAAFELELAEAPPHLAPTALATLNPPPIKLKLRIREKKKMYNKAAR